MNEYDLKIKTAAVLEPVDLAAAKMQLRVEATETYWDAEIQAMLDSATELVTEMADISLGQTSYTLRLRRFPRPKSGDCAIYLPRGPLISVDAIRYTDIAGDAATIAAEDFSIIDDMASLVFPAPGTSWPAVSCDTPRAVEIDYTSGYATQGAIPKRAVHAIKLIVADWYLQREDYELGNVSRASRSLIEQLRPGDEFHRPGEIS